MALITLASATGSPGVTTTALGLALQWPGAVLLADCDRDPSQALQAGYLQGLDLGGRGLVPLTRAHREHRSLAEELWLQTVTFEVGARHERRLLPGFSHPGAAHLFEPIWDGFVDVLAGLDETGTDVIVDAGRIGAQGLPPALVARSDLLLVCTRTSLRALASLRLHLPVLQQQVDLAGGGVDLGLLLVGGGRPYGAGEIEKQFGVAVVHDVAWEPRQAEVFSDGAVPTRQLLGGALVRSYRACASDLAGRVAARRQLVGQTGHQPLVPAVTP